MKNEIDNTSFRQVMGSFATGIAVITAQNAELGMFGLTVNSLTSVSLDPPLALFCLDKTAQLYKAFRSADLFAINLLAADQENVSRYFADRHHNAKPKNLWDKAAQNCPLLRGTLAWALCRPQAFYKGGDHTIFLGEVIALYKRVGSKEPLLYFHGRYREMADPGVPSGKVTSGARK
jgi:flavin reductase (DIM6/NTAB) family NADH-FMN oxidoreductase RutF